MARGYPKEDLAILNIAWAFKSGLIDAKDLVLGIKHLPHSMNKETEMNQIPKIKYSENKDSSKQINEESVIESTIFDEIDKGIFLEGKLWLQ